MSEAERARALRRVLLRQRLRLWASKARQERAELAEEVMALFSSAASASGSSNSASGGADKTPAIAERPITRRPGVEEVKSCLLASLFPCLPAECASLRSEIWQVLLNVYKRKQHGAAAQEFDRMIARLSKLPRDSMLVDECADVALLLEPQDAAERERVQQDMEVLLMWFLTTKSVAYTSGMARVVAPFFLQNMALPTIYDCFYQYSANFLPHFVVNDAPFGDAPGSANDSSSFSESRLSIDSLSSLTGILPRSGSMDSTSSTAEEARRRVEEEEEKQKSREKQQLVEQLLSYHDPQLSHFLTQWCGNDWSTPGELIKTDFFLGHLYQVMPPAVFVYVMDQYLLTGDSLFGVFVLVAALIHGGELLMSGGQPTAEDVRKNIREIFSTATFSDSEHVQLLCFLAARLRSKTPKTYKCSQHEATPEMRCSSRLATELAFTKAPPTKKKSRSSQNSGSGIGSNNSSNGDRFSTASDIVDMSQWVMKESRSLAGKVFWYHKSTGKTQWEHPAEKLDAPAAAFALPISIEEVGAQVMGEKVSDQNGPRFFVVDCRGLRSSDDLKSGRIPAAYTLDPSVFDSPELIAKSMDAFNPMKSRVHVVLVGHGVGIPPQLVTSEEVKTSIRDAARLDIDCINQAALFFQKRGFRFVSCLDGGYASWHAFMRDNPACSPSELLNHVEEECVYCRYDTILRTGEDPFKQKKKQQTKVKRKKSAMPTTTSLLVNGGEGDPSIVSTNSNMPKSTGSTSSGGMGAVTLGRQLSLSRQSITSMRSKLSEVKIPKLQWRRRSSGASAQNNQNDSGSSSETLEDNGSDHEFEDGPADVNDDATHKMLREALEQADDVAVDAGDAKDKSFVGVFTIDYSDDEDDEPSDNNAEVKIESSAAAPTISA